MSQAIECPSCGKRAFHSNFHAAEPASQFLWIKRPAKPAELVLECLRCGWKHSYAPGSIRAAQDVMRSLEFDTL